MKLSNLILLSVGTVSAQENTDLSQLQALLKLPGAQELLGKLLILEVNKIITLIKPTCKSNKHQSKHPWNHQHQLRQLKLPKNHQMTNLSNQLTSKAQFQWSQHQWLTLTQTKMFTLSRVKWRPRPQVKQTSSCPRLSPYWSQLRCPV